MQENTGCSLKQGSRRTGENALGRGQICRPLQAQILSEDAFDGLRTQVMRDGVLASGFGERVRRQMKPLRGNTWACYGTTPPARLHPGATEQLSIACRPCGIRLEPVEFADATAYLTRSIKCVCHVPKIFFASQARRLSRLFPPSSRLTRVGVSIVWIARQVVHRQCDTYSRSSIVVVLSHVTHHRWQLCGSYGYSSIRNCVDENSRFACIDFMPRGWHSSHLTERETMFTRQ